MCVKQSALLPLSTDFSRSELINVLSTCISASHTHNHHIFAMHNLPPQSLRNIFYNFDFCTLQLLSVRFWILVSPAGSRQSLHSFSLTYSWSFSRGLDHGVATTIYADGLYIVFGAVDKSSTHLLSTLASIVFSMAFERLGNSTMVLL